MAEASCQARVHQALLRMMVLYSYEIPHACLCTHDCQDYIRNSHHSNGFQFKNDDNETEQRLTKKVFWKLEMQVNKQVG